MRFLGTVGPTAGNINAMLALLRLLRDDGHTVAILSGMSAGDHLARYADGIETFLGNQHEIDFDRSRTGRLPHLQQLCDANTVVAACGRELAILEQFQPDVVINKHFYSVIASTRCAGIPMASLVTDGPEYLLPGRNPQRSSSSRTASESLAAAFHSLGLAPPTLEPPYCLLSDRLNLVRGTAETACLQPDELDALPATTQFCGNLTFSGFGIDADHGIPALPPGRRIAYVTFGTVANDDRALNSAIAALRRAGFFVVCSTYNVPKEQILDGKDILVGRYLENAVVLPQCDLVAHHGGHGTYLEAMDAAVPQLIVPDNDRSSAQAIHGRNAAALGIGGLLAKAASEAEWREAIQRLVAPSIRARAWGMRHRLRRDTNVLTKQMLTRLQRL